MPVTVGGTDILLRGDESGLGTPAEDMTSLAAVAGLDTVPVRLVACIGFGIDAYHGVNHPQVLENIADLDAAGAYLILGRILAQLHTLTSRDAGIRQEIAKLQEHRVAADLITFLRTQNIVIDCRATSVSLGADHEKLIIVSTRANTQRQEVRIPRQRIQLQKQKRGIADR